jgi:hypothetical protein
MDNSPHGRQGMKSMAKPKIVSAEEWAQARGELLTAEKEATHTLDALAARRRRDWEDSPPGWPQRPTYTDEQTELLEQMDGGKGGGTRRTAENATGQRPR